METRAAAERWRDAWARGWRSGEAAEILALYAEGPQFGDPIVDGDRAAVQWWAETKLKDGGAERLPGSRSCASTRTASWPSNEISGPAPEARKATARACLYDPGRNVATHI